MFMFPALRQTLGVHKSGHDRKVETEEKRQLLKNENL
jgi:hypothetical protein